MLNLFLFDFCIMCNNSRHKLSAEALRESVIFAKRITGPEAVKLKIVDSTEEEGNLIAGGKRLGLQALGGNNIHRADLQNMKKDLIPRQVLQSVNTSKL